MQGGLPRGESQASGSRSRPRSRQGRLPALLGLAAAGVCLAGARGQAPSSARLRLYTTDGSNDGGTLFAVATTFDEKKITWQNAPACTGAPVAVTGIVNAGAWVELDVRSAIHGTGVYDFCLASASSDSAIYSSKEGTKPPELVIGPAPAGCSSAAACSDGKLCNGAEACVAG